MSAHHEIDNARTVAADHAPGVGASIAWESPEAVLADEGLSLGQKMRFLKEWRAALADHLGSKEVAEADVPGETELLARIDRTLEILGSS